MPKTRNEKEEILAKLTEALQSRALIFINYTGLTVAETNALRDELYNEKCAVKITKNTLLKRALEGAKLEIDDTLLDQPLALVVSPDDEVAVSKIVQKCVDEHESAEILGGIIGGEFVDAGRVKLLSTLPGREELLAKAVGSINAPISGLVTVMVGNLRGLVSVLKQYQEKKAN